MRKYSHALIHMCSTRGMCVGCLKIIKDKSSKAESQTPDAGLISANTAAPRREGRNPRLSSTKARGSKPASQQHQGARVETRASVVTVPVIGLITAHITGKVNPHYGVFFRRHVRP